jgi:UBA-like domain/Thioredoxin-like/UBX domain
MDSDLIATFVAMTDSSAEIAAQYLEMANFDIDVACNLYWDHGAGHNPSQGNPHVSQNIQHDDVRAPMEFTTDILNRGGPIEDFEEAEEDHSEPDYLFRSAASTSVSGTNDFSTVLSRAKEASKLVVVNIQDANNFSSHVLNRDIWSNETVKELLEASFFFWQAEKENASAFIANYKVTEFPFIGIIDSRTGRMLKYWNFPKFAEPLLAIECLSPFLDYQHQPRIKKPVETQNIPIIENTSQDEIQRRKCVVDLTEEKVLRPPQIPVLPTSADPGTVRLAVRFPTGQRETIFLFPSSKIQLLVDYIAAKQLCMVTDVELKTTIPPIKVLENFEATIEDEQISGCLITAVLKSK